MPADPIEDFARHVVETDIADIPDTAQKAARTFILDTLGVGISGSNGPMAQELVASLQQMGGNLDARVWSTGERLPSAMAAMCNAYQTHCQEYDCVHEAAVAHVMTIVLPAALAGAERMGGIPGTRLLEAVVLGVDVAASIGEAASSGLRFFRPGTAGLLGGTAALGKLMLLDKDLMVEAFSLAYGQMCGTMQAHTEGSGLLAMQMGFNARNAVTACDLASAGFTGPKDILSGEFGYFSLIEEGGDPERLAARLGTDWKITEVAHKPFPSGRATHGILDGCLGLQRQYGFGADDISQIRLTVPPLIEHLVGRPPHSEMSINYARLSARYVLACAMMGTELVMSDFTPAAYLCEKRQALAARISVLVLDEGDPNALVPIGVEVDLADGQTLKTRVDHVYGSPAKPLSPDAHLAKFRKNCNDGVRPLGSDQTDRLVEAVEYLERLHDVRTLIDMLMGSLTPKG
ncbi:MAG: MmgE/PrpD family protein [Paracoccaceae bacterium]